MTAERRALQPRAWYIRKGHTLRIHGRLNASMLRGTVISLGPEISLVRHEDGGAILFTKASVLGEKI